METRGKTGKTIRREARKVIYCGMWVACVHKQQWGEFLFYILVVRCKEPQRTVVYLVTKAAKKKKRKKRKKKKRKKKKKGRRERNSGSTQHETSKKCNDLCVFKRSALDFCLETGNFQN